MYKGKKIIVTICARSGSKGIPKKNVRLVLGKPLISYTINQAKKLSWVDRIVISTDDINIKRLSEKLGVSVPFLRPKYLATDNTGKVPVIIHSVVKSQKLWKEKYDINIDLAVTSPLRTNADIQKSLDLLFIKKTKTVLSGYLSNNNPYFNMVEMNLQNNVILSKRNGKELLRRQDAPPVYSLNGSIYIAWTRSFLKGKTYFTNRTRIYVMPKEQSIDLDTEMDLKFLEFYLKSKKIKNIK